MSLSRASRRGAVVGALLVGLALFPAAARGLAAEPAPRIATWEGETKQGRRVVFDVEKVGGRREVNEFYASSKFKCSNGETRIGNFRNLRAPIKKGTFSIRRSNPPSIPPWSTYVNGTFNSKRRAEGTVRGSYTDLVDHSIVCTGEKVHWTAKATAHPPTRRTARATHEATYRSHVKILALTPEPDDTYMFDGRVRAKKEGCVTGRNVRLYRRRPGPDKLIGRARASDEGFWFVRKQGAKPGTYYAQVKRKRIGPRGHRHTCSAATSPGRTVAGTG